MNISDKMSDLVCTNINVQKDEIIYKNDEKLRGGG